MRQRVILNITLACTVLVAAAATTVEGQYSLTVNRDRLINAQNEPRNW